MGRFPMLQHMAPTPIRAAPTRLGWPIKKQNRKEKKTSTHTNFEGGLLQGLEGKLGDWNDRVSLYMCMELCSTLLFLNSIFKLELIFFLEIS